MMELKVESLKFTEADLNNLDVMREMFIEYARSLGFNLCFQNFDRELASLPGVYAPPNGRLILAELDGTAVGCIALTRIDDETCEMKRLYVKPEYRGLGIGKRLVDHLLSEARRIGYVKMRLDTIDTMEAAIGIYFKAGFKEIEPYRYNPIDGARFFEVDLILNS